MLFSRPGPAACCAGTEQLMKTTNNCCTNCNDNSNNIHPLISIKLLNDDKL